MMIENGLDGGFSLTMYRIVMTQSWSVTVAAGDEQVIIIPILLYYILLSCNFNCNVKCKCDKMYRLQILHINLKILFLKDL